MAIETNEEFSIVVPADETVEPLTRSAESEAPGTAPPPRRQRRRRQPSRREAGGARGAARRDAAFAISRAAAHRFRVQLMMEAEDVQDALRKTESLGPVEIVAITREM